MLQQVGLHQRRDLRFGLLSTGEQRRCMIARALAHEPELLILDEPTAGLDLAGREQVLATIEMILAGAKPPTVLMVTHRVEELSPRTRQVLLMKEGRVVAAGPPKEVITPESLTSTFGCKVFVSCITSRASTTGSPAGGVARSAVEEIKTPTPVVAGSVFRKERRNQL